MVAMALICLLSCFTPLSLTLVPGITFLSKSHTSLYRSSFRAGETKAGRKMRMRNCNVRRLCPQKRRENNKNYLKIQ